MLNPAVSTRLVDTTTWLICQISGSSGMAHIGTLVRIRTAVSWSSAGTSIALDPWILLFPLWQLRSLKLHGKEKVRVALMLCVGTL